jgi:hypothetical protein
MSQQRQEKTIAWQQFKGVLDNAVKDLLRLDGDLLETATHQRTYCARLAWYLERHLPPHLRASETPSATLPREGYVVDVEYNRADRSESKILHRT